MSDIRVAMLAPPWLSIPPKGYGGIENVIAALVPELKKLGVQVELFATGDSKIPGVKRHALYKTGQYEHIHKPQYDSLPIEIAHLLYSIDIIKKDGKFDIIHDHNGFLGPMALWHANGNLPPTVHTLHGPPFTTSDRLELGIPDNLPMWQQFKATHKLYFVPISRALVKNAPRQLKSAVLQPIHNAVDAEQFPFVSKKDDYFMTLGRFHPDKGQHIAVQACLDVGHRLKMGGSVGDISTPKRLLMELANPLSSYRSLLDFRYYSDLIFPYLLEGQIENLGEISGDHKLKTLSRAKALLFPIQWDEPFGMVAIEALACGTPVIAMARGALPEIIDHGVTGFLAHNEKEFRHYMKHVDDIDPAACRAAVLDKFSARNMAKAYLKAYQKIIARHPQTASA